MSKTMLKRFLGALVSVFVAGGNVAFAQSLAGSEWGMAAKPERFIQFQAKGKVSGFAGCNRFFGSYEHKPPKLAFGRLATTRKACPTTVMAAEKAFLDALNATLSATAKRGGKMRLRNKAGRIIVVLQHRDWD